ncbi:unnamed protein product [Toxocara canis]|uniref:Clathrin_bdg domain-containing protein n=1 Tax=Toxocara canis TaxID=6265 RepID=A0A183V9Q9_TOXCA|nr:unnamed protein product [Toxocara canis]
MEHQEQQTWAVRLVVEAGIALWWRRSVLQEMFEDGPPPLPPSLPPSEAAAEAALADLTDDNRLTAVADEDLDSDHESRPSCTPAVPNFDPDVFENISRSTETADALDRIPSLGKEGAYGTYESKNEPQETGTNTESPSGLSKDCSEIPVPTVAEGVANESNTMVSPEEKRPNENVQEIERTEGEINVIREVTSNRHLPSAFQGPIKYSASAEHEHSHVEMRPTESEETVSLSEQEPEVSFANEIRPQVVLEEKTEDKSKSDQPAEAVENTSEEMRVQPSVSPSFLEKTDDAITAVGGTFEATAEGNREDDDGDDDFGDFEEFGEFAETRFEESNAIEEPKEKQQDFGGWAAFETAPSSSQDVKEGGEDEWAADFTTAPSPPASSTWQQAPSSGEQRYDRIELCALCDIYGRDSLWTAENVDWDGGEDEPESCEDELQGVTECLDGAQLTLDNLKPWQSSWLAISVVEDALALKMQWPHSVFYSKFLDSLSLDANLAAMRNSDLPAFAQQLGESAILQPISTADYADTNFESTPPLSNLW